MVEKALKKFYVFLIFVFLYAPIIILIIFSFNNSKTLSKWDGFTFKWYLELFKDDEIMKSLYYTIVIACLSSVISTLIGIFAALSIHNMKGFKKKIILNINYLPVLNPDIVTAISFMTLFKFMSMNFGFMTMLLSHIAFNVPYVVLSILPKLKHMNKYLEEAAMDLGATPLYALRKVIIPEIMPGIITGGLLAFTLSIDDFVISFFNTGNGVTNLSITVYSMARRGIKPELNALSTIMFSTVLILLLLINKRNSKEDGGGLM
ncbi:ABC transporter permease [Acidilutibacter cellobiosedens]|jgi:spermidine/putrescine transport system permease protein|uniref:ABC transporter permease n=1 Tax=Acidilutibacter cellobiosedens TaxID=2507161 RepID=A0A410QEK7_9FIRM|nr:ABC transporter permease [Acidilutibacter cellobiosedens]QAT62268.1 ABC transporter permease [Acidilutibacter cellobiosedens]